MSGKKAKMARKMAGFRVKTERLRKEFERDWDEAIAEDIYRNRPQRRHSTSHATTIAALLSMSHLP